MPSAPGIGPHYTDPMRRVVLTLLLLWLPLQPQRNAPWIGLMLPVHAALWWLYARVGLVRQAGAAQDAQHA